MAFMGCDPKVENTNAPRATKGPSARSLTQVTYMINQSNATPRSSARGGKMVVDHMSRIDQFEGSPTDLLAAKVGISFRDETS